MVMLFSLYSVALADYTELVTTSWSNTVNLGSHSGQYVTLYMYNTSTMQVNQVRMLNANGQVVWPGEGNDIPNSGSRRFWCGSDVAVIQVRIVNGGIGYPNCYCNIHFG